MPARDVKVTGPAGFSTDLKNVFAGADTRLLAVTGGLVLFLLILIYRSPIFWVIPTTGRQRSDPITAMPSVLRSTGACG